jgi:hypothetical protein
MSARTTPAPGQREHWSDYDANTLHRILVEDALAAHATELKWAVGAYSRIGKLTGKGAEAAFAAVREEVNEMGMPMPMHSGPIS